MNELSTLNGLNIISDVDLGQIQNSMNKIAQFQSVVQKSLKENHDYGVIPGTSKPTLLKPGAEKILMLMGITSEYEITEKVQDYERGFFAFSVKCILKKGSLKITEGVGHCNTKEDKYRYRWAFENEVPDSLDKESLKSKQFGRHIKYQIENDEPYSLVNTVLKMAKKRAQIDATLTVASLSEIFTQDLEDMRDFIQSEQMETMNDQDAANIKLAFGKHKGKTLGELLKTNRDYIEWLSEKANDAFMRKAATTLLMESHDNSSANEEVSVSNDDEFQPVDDDDLPF